MSELPPGWAEAVLGDIAETRLGKMLSAKARAGANPRPYLRNKNVQWGRFDLSDLLVMDFDDDEFERFKILPGDLLVCEGGEVGRAAIWRGQIDAVGYQKALHRIRPAPAVSADYLLYAFRWFADTHAFETFVTGSTINHLPQEDLRRLPIPLPPEAEQPRIVAAIEEDFSRLHAAEQSLHLARRKLAALRRTVLARAVEGDWPVSPLGSVLISLRNGIFVSRPAAEPPGIPIFRISAVRPLALAVDDVRFADIDAEKANGYFVEEGDLLFTRYSGNPDYVGACAFVQKLPQPTLHPDKLIRAVVDGSIAEPAFIAIALSIGSGRKAIEERRKTTAGQVGIAGSELKQVPVSVPPLDEQRRIVAEVDWQLSLVEAMDAQIDRALRRSGALRRSILEQAFSGKLVPQDPSDEPASVLLERIAAERAAAPKPSRRKRKIPA